MSDVKIRSAARTRVRPLEEPLAKRALVPDPDRLADGVVLRDGIAEVGDPVPALPLGEGPAHPPLDLVERGLKQSLRSDRRCRWGISISSVAAEPRSKGAAVASIGGIGTSTGMITVGVARRVSSWWPGGSTCVTPIRPRTLAGPATRLVRLDRLLLARGRCCGAGGEGAPGSRRRGPGVEKIACST